MQRAIWPLVPTRLRRRTVLVSRAQRNWLRRAAFIALLAGPLLSVACASGSDGDADDLGEAGTNATAAGSGAESGSAGAVDSAGLGGSDGAGAGAGAGGDADMEHGGAGGSSAAPHLPCDVEDVIRAKCQRCHDQPQRNGAPFPLLTWEDTRRQHGLQLVYQAMLPAIEMDFMPLTQLVLEPPVEALTADEKALLLTWLRDGATPVIGASCD